MLVAASARGRRSRFCCCTAGLFVLCLPSISLLARIRCFAVSDGEIFFSCLFRWCSHPHDLRRIQCGAQSLASSCLLASLLVECSLRCKRFASATTRLCLLARRTHLGHLGLRSRCVPQVFGSFASADAAEESGASTGLAVRRHSLNDASVQLSRSTCLSMHLRIEERGLAAVRCAARRVLRSASEGLSAASRNQHTAIS
eukprot:5119392-Pleurochrysis_carterae.AAC.2